MATAPEKAEENREDTIYGLLEIAERQQTAAQGALDGLSAEREMFARERVEWMSGVGSIKDDVRSAVLAAVAESTDEAVQVAAEAVKEATDELMASLACMSDSVVEAESSLRTIAAWASARLLIWILSAIAALLLLWWLANCCLLWWDSSAIGAAQARKSQLIASVAELESNRDAWAKTGMLSKISQCGPARRPCIRIDESAGSFGDQGDMRVLR
jgi:hypothetical protein